MKLSKIQGIKKSSRLEDFSVDPLGLELRLFGTKNRRVASYTMGNALQSNEQTTTKEPISTTFSNLQ
jgi:hypothetical protein